MKSARVLREGGASVDEEAVGAAEGETTIEPTGALDEGPSAHPEEDGAVPA